jgi:F0F1-type ATP synthase membrane subunit b/b'
VAARIADAEARINETKSKAMAHVNAIASETADAIVARLIGQDRRVAAKAEAGE